MITTKFTSKPITTPKPRPGRAGFTLVELLIYMAVLSILLLVMVNLFASLFDIKLGYEANSSVSQDGSYIITRLTNDLQQTNTVVSPGAGSTDSVLQITGQTVNYTYQLSGGNLVLTDNNASTSNQLNSYSTTITAASFTVLGSGAAGSKSAIKVSITVQGKADPSGGKVQSQTFTTTMETR